MSNGGSSTSVLFMYAFTMSVFSSFHWTPDSQKVADCPTLFDTGVAVTVLSPCLNDVTWLIRYFSPRVANTLSWLVCDVATFIFGVKLHPNESWNIGRALGFVIVSVVEVRFSNTSAGTNPTVPPKLNVGRCERHSLQL